MENGLSAIVGSANDKEGEGRGEAVEVRRHGVYG